MKVNKKTLNEELLEWAGFTCTTGVWTYPDGETVDGDVPYFPEDLNAIFKWLVLKANGLGYNVRTYTYYDGIGTDAFIDRALDNTDIVERDKDPALALFWAIYKVIDET